VKHACGDTLRWSAVHLGMVRKLAAVALLAACSGGNSSDISVRPAPFDQCAAGGAVLTIDGTEQLICNGTDGADGTPAEGLPGSAIVVANVQCSGGYQSGDEPVSVDLNYVEFSDGNQLGMCSVSRRYDRVIDVASFTGGICSLIDWTSIDPDGGTDASGNPLALGLVVDAEAEMIMKAPSLADIANSTATVIAPLVCTAFDPGTGDYL